MKIFYGILFFIIGCALIKYRKTVYEWTGRFVWAERYLGNGGTVIVILLAGCMFLFLSVAYPLGAIDLGTRELVPSRPMESSEPSASASE